jgi:hypothetical protein
MSCESPFVIPEPSTFFFSKIYIFGCTGSVSVPEYTTPTYTTSVGGQPISNTTCSPGTVIWPTFLLSGTASIPIGFELDNNNIVISSVPPTSPYGTSYLYIYSFDFNYNLNGTDYSIPNIGPLSVSTNNDIFSSSILLGNFTESFVIDGFTISSIFTLTLLFCLNPVLPNGWVTLQVGVEFTTSACDVSYSTSFLLNLPVISVKEKENEG